VPAPLTDAQDNKRREHIKICHVIITLSILGGAQRMLVRLLLANPESTHNKMVLVLREAGAWGEQLSAAGVTVHELGMESFKDIPRVFGQLKLYMRSFQPDIVQTWMYHADLLGGLAARLSGYKKIIWGIRRTALSWSDSKSTLIIMKVCALLSYWLPKKIVSVAEAGRQAHIQAGYCAKRMVVIGNGFDFANLSATEADRNNLRRECKILEDEMVIGCLGRFNQAKGQDNFVKAAAIVKQSNAKTKFLMVGKDCDASNHELLEWIKDTGFQDAFILLGERHDVPVCLATMDIFCMPSRTEGFPNALGEAMAMSLPCVATEVGDTKVLAGDSVVLVPPLNESALANALLGIIALPSEQRQKMGADAKARVITEFSMESACEKFKSIYSELISETVS
jgi:glycosyltransferase involved in cell wall biosynthesis